jgi:hypothetical protein
MASQSDNVVLTQPAAEALCREFVGWQCRLRQLAARQYGGRPMSGMRPRVLDAAGRNEFSPGVTMLIVESEPENSTELFRYEYSKTQDPNERCDRMVEFLQGSYFQEPARFADLMTALFGPGSSLAALLREERHCILEFEQYSQTYRIPCRVVQLPERSPHYQATYWHNRMFNPNQPAGVEILSFRPDWRHASGYRGDSG